MDLNISLEGIIIICATYLLGKTIHSVYLFNALQKKREDEDPTEEEEG